MKRVDFATIFGGWVSSSSSSAADSAGTSMQGLLVSMHTHGDHTRLQLRTPDAVVSLSLPSTAVVPGMVDVLDEVRVGRCVERTAADGRVFINAATVERVTPWTQLDTNEPVPMPLPVDGKGAPFVLRWATGGVEAAPGLHRKLNTWEVMSVKERRLHASLTLREWATLEEVPDVQPLKLILTIWDNHWLSLEQRGAYP